MYQCPDPTFLWGEDHCLTMQIFGSCKKLRHKGVKCHSRRYHYLQVRRAGLNIRSPTLKTRLSPSTLHSSYDFTNQTGFNPPGVQTSSFPGPILFLYMNVSTVTLGSGRLRGSLSPSNRELGTDCLRDALGPVRLLGTQPCGRHFLGTCRVPGASADQHSPKL